MNRPFFPVGKRVRITKPGLFKGLRGTIQHVTVRCDEGRIPVCWYRIRVDVRAEPVWLNHSEVKPLDGAPFAEQATWS